MLAIMANKATVLVIGATGMLGRPVVRRLVAEGFRVRALVRDVGRARRMLPVDCEVHQGNLFEPASLAAEMRSVDAVHLNLAAPMRTSAPSWEPELHGTRAALQAARAADVRHLLRISALGVDDAAPQWWAARHKAEADRAVVESGLPYTILRPTWFMESIPTMMFGSTILRLPLPDDARLRWLAGDDFARQVAAAISDRSAMNAIVVSQGPELLSFNEALARFRRAWPGRLVTLPVPAPMLRLMSHLSGKAHYLWHLLEMTQRHFARLDRAPAPTPLPAAIMTIEDYVKYVKQTSDRPRK